MIFSRLFKKREEILPSKNSDTYYELLNDGIRPGVSPYSYIVRTPVGVRIESGDSRVLKLGIKFDRACLIVPRGILSAAVADGSVDVRVSGVGGDILLPPDTEVVVWVNNRSRNDFSLLEQEALFDVIPLPPVEQPKKR